MNNSPVKYLSLVLVLSLTIPFIGCRKRFGPALVKAEAAFADKNFVNAIDIINSVIPLWSDSDGIDAKARAYEILGESYHALRNNDKAMEAYKQAVDLSDKTYGAAYSLGILYLTKGQPEMAQTVFEKALKMKPNDPLALLGLGNSLYVQKRFVDAEAMYKKILIVSPGVSEALESLAVLKQARSTKTYRKTLPSRSPKRPASSIKKNK